MYTNYFVNFFSATSSLIRTQILEILNCTKIKTTALVKFKNLNTEKLSKTCVFQNTLSLTISAP